MKFAKNGIGKRRRPREKIENQDESKFEAKKRKDDAQPSARPPLGNIRRARTIGSQPNHFVDNELADIQCQDRLYSAGQPQSNACNRQPATGPPDLGHEPAEIAKVGKPLAKGETGRFFWDAGGGMG